MLPDRFTFKAVGISFLAEYPDNLYQLKGAWLVHGDQERLPVVLRRDPGNEHDPNCVEVHVPAVGRIGHVPRFMAARLAPEMDDGQVWQGEVSEVLEHPEHPDRPGITVTLHRMKESAGA